jgi:riboflavin kinase
MGLRKQRIRVTEEGRAILQAEHLLYARLFEQRDRIELSGIVKTGLGEGRYYLSRPGYQTQFRKALGWEPYPGTLNLELSGPEANKLRFLRKNPVYTIESFHAEGRTFGGVTCHPARVGKQECAAILPHRSHYTTTIELIAPVRLRDALPCSDGQRLEVTVDLHGKADAAAGGPKAHPAAASMPERHA